MLPICFSHLQIFFWVSLLISLVWRHFLFLRNAPRFVHHGGLKFPKELHVSHSFCFFLEPFYFSNQVKQTWSAVATYIVHILWFVFHWSRTSCCIILHLRPGLIIHQILWHAFFMLGICEAMCNTHLLLASCCIICTIEILTWARATASNNMQHHN